MGIDIDRDYCWAVAGVGGFGYALAVRLFRRRPEVKRVREFWYMEVPSCTEWKINSAMVSFNPNCYVEVGKAGVDAKVKALSMYRGVMRPYPHPRSAEFIEGLAAYRGGQWGLLRGYGDRRKEASFASESIDHIKTKKSNKNTEND